MNDEILIEPNDSEIYICENGCGECTPVQIDFEYSREEDTEGTLLESKAIKIWVSDCCEESMMIYNDATDEEREATK